MSKLPQGTKHAIVGLLIGTAYGIAMSALWRGKGGMSGTGGAVKASSQKENDLSLLEYSHPQTQATRASGRGLHMTSACRSHPPLNKRVTHSCLRRASCLPAVGEFYRNPSSSPSADLHSDTYPSPTGKAACMIPRVCSTYHIIAEKQPEMQRVRRERADYHRASRR